MSKKRKAYSLMNNPKRREYEPLEDLVDAEPLRLEEVDDFVGLSQVSRETYIDQKRSFIHVADRPEPERRDAFAEPLIVTCLIVMHGVESKFELRTNLPRNTFVSPVQYGMCSTGPFLSPSDRLLKIESYKAEYTDKSFTEGNQVVLDSFKTGYIDPSTDPDLFSQHSATSLDEARLRESYYRSGFIRLRERSLVNNKRFELNKGDPSTISRGIFVISVQNSPCAEFTRILTGDNLRDEDTAGWDDMDEPHRAHVKLQNRNLLNVGNGIRMMNSVKALYEERERGRVLAESRYRPKSFLQRVKGLFYAPPPSTPLEELRYKENRVIHTTSSDLVARRNRSTSRDGTGILHYDSVWASDIFNFFGKLGFDLVNSIDTSCRATDKFDTKTNRDMSRKERSRRKDLPKIFGRPAKSAESVPSIHNHLVYRGLRPHKRNIKRWTVKHNGAVLRHQSSRNNTRV